MNVLGSARLKGGGETLPYFTRMVEPILAAEPVLATTAFSVGGH